MPEENGGRQFVKRQGTHSEYQKFQIRCAKVGKEQEFYEKTETEPKLVFLEGWK